MSKQTITSLVLEERVLNLEKLLSTEENTPALSVETLLDMFLAVYTDCKLASNKNEHLSRFVEKCTLI